jgi:hypothetical protein
MPSRSITALPGLVPLLKKWFADNPSFVQQALDHSTPIEIVWQLARIVGLNENFVCTRVAFSILSIGKDFDSCKVVLYT